MTFGSAGNAIESGLMNKGLYVKLLSYINSKDWWHVPPADPKAYEKRGKFLASTFRGAEFYGRPLDLPLKVTIRKPLVGDERAIARVLHIGPQRPGMSLKQISQHDAKWHNAALAKGYDSIVLMAARSFAAFKASGKIPRGLELNVLSANKPKERKYRS
jgi:hypothetical protein